MTAPDLLQWLSLGQKSGTLVISGRGVEKRIFFKEGRILSSASTDPREYLGQFLMSHGYITEDELKKAMEVQAQSQILLGKILVMINAISEDDLVRLMRLKAEESIYDIFLWPEGEFFFLDEELPTMALIPLQVDVTGILLEGSRRIDEWKRIRAVIQENDLMPVLEKPVAESELTEVQRIVYRAINGNRSIDEIVLESRSSSFIVCETLYLLSSEHQAVKFVDRSSVQPRVVEPAVDTELEEQVFSMVGRAQAALRALDFEKAMKQLKAAQNLDPNSPVVKSAMKSAEMAIGAEMRRIGIGENRVPKIVKTFEQISAMNFSPNEGFILSRINGVWDVSSIAKISPMREIDALLIFHKLHREGIIAF